MSDGFVSQDEAGLPRPLGGELAVEPQPEDMRQINLKLL